MSTLSYVKHPEHSLTFSQSSKTSVEVLEALTEWTVMIWKEKSHLDNAETPPGQTGMQEGIWDMSNIC